MRGKQFLVGLLAAVFVAKGTHGQEASDAVIPSAVDNVPASATSFPPTHPMYPELTSALSNVADAKAKLAAARAALEAALRESGAKGQTSRALRAAYDAAVKESEASHQRLAQAESEVQAAEAALKSAKETETELGGKSTAAKALVDAKEAAVAKAQTEAQNLKAAAEKAAADLARVTKEAEGAGLAAQGHKEHTKVAEARVHWVGLEKAAVQARVALHDATAALAKAQAEHAQAKAAHDAAKAHVAAMQGVLAQAVKRWEQMVASVTEALTKAKEAFEAEDKILHDMYQQLIDLFKRTKELRTGVSWFHHFYTYYAYYTIKLDKPKEHYCDIAADHETKAEHEVHHHTRRFYKDACDHYDVHIKYEPIISKHPRDYYHEAWNKYYAAHDESRDNYIEKHRGYGDVQAKATELKNEVDKLQGHLNAVIAQRDHDLSIKRGQVTAAENAAKVKAQAETAAAAALASAVSLHAEKANAAEKATEAASASKTAFEGLLATCKSSEHCHAAFNEIEAKFSATKVTTTTSAASGPSD